MTFEKGVLLPVRRRSGTNDALYEIARHDEGFNKVSYSYLDSSGNL